MPIQFIEIEVWKYIIILHFAYLFHTCLLFLFASHSNEPNADEFTAVMNDVHRKRKWSQEIMLFSRLPFIFVWRHVANFWECETEKIWKKYDKSKSNAKICSLLLLFFFLRLKFFKLVQWILFSFCLLILFWLLALGFLHW